MPKKKSERGANLAKFNGPDAAKKRRRSESSEDEGDVYEPGAPAGEEPPEELMHEVEADPALELQRRQERERQRKCRERKEVAAAHPPATLERFFGGGSSAAGSAARSSPRRPRCSPRRS